jgi:hypothetical protein
MEEKSCGQAACGKSKDKVQHKTMAEHNLDDFIHGNLLNFALLPKNIYHQGRKARRTKEHEGEVRLARKRWLAPLRYLAL